MPPARILILGGTRDARELASALVGEGHSVITSLAGVTAKPLLPRGKLRIGGFGGVAGLVDYLRKAAIGLVVDATHPFAAQMSAHAHDACVVTNLPLLRLVRPAWLPDAGDRWLYFASPSDAAAALPPGARPLVTIGRKEIGCFLDRADLAGVARMIERPGMGFAAGWTVLQERPPFSVAAEEMLMRTHEITHLVTKNAGGSETQAKLEAARALGLPVLMIARPDKPAARCVATVEEAVRAIAERLEPSQSGNKGGRGP